MTKEEILSELEKKQVEYETLKKEIDSLQRELNKITSQSTTKLTIQQKIDIFMNYFKGRDDVYPYFSIDKSNPNKKYYIPACQNEWKQNICNKTMGKKCKDCHCRENKPLDRQVIYNHMYQGKTIGIYPLLEDDRCFLLAFDFDDKNGNKNIEKDVKAFIDTCHEFDVPLAIEKSRSGNGFHLWIFFHDKIKALTARKLGSLLLSKAMEKSVTLEIDTFDRMFPNQDTLPKGGYGNLIALPFQTEPAKQGNTILLDENFKVIENQFEYLNGIHKLSESEVFDRIKQISDVTLDITCQDVPTISESKIKEPTFDFPKSINIIRNDMIYISKKDLNSSVYNIIKKLATFSNPEFYKKQKLRMPVYNIPMVIDCSKQDDEYLKLPRGTYEKLQELCEKNNIEMLIDDRRNPGSSIELDLSITLRENQEEVLESLLLYDTGILEAPTSFGKTVVSCALIAKRKVNTLIITPSLSLLRQWQEKIREFLNFEAGQIGGGKKNITNIIDVACIKSIWNKGNFMDIVKNYGIVIIDECHHLSAVTYESALNTVNAKYVYGASATVKKENGHTPIIKMQCGEIRHKINFKEFNQNLNVDMLVLAKKTHLNFTDKNITDYTINEIYNFISKDVIRNEKIIKDIEHEFDKGKNILILTERIEHLNYFQEKLSKYTNNLLVYKGGMGKKELKKYDELNKNIQENDQNKIILATGSCIGEGFDDSSLDVMFLTMPISGKNRLTQYAGRLHRKTKNKKEIIIYDYIDDNFRQTRSMFEKRKKTYTSMGYRIEE